MVAGRQRELQAACLVQLFEPNPVLLVQLGFLMVAVVRANLQNTRTSTSMDSIVPDAASSTPNQDDSLGTTTMSSSN